MNWQKNRDDLKPICNNFRDFGHYDKTTKANRNKILVENNYSCRYCGGTYAKYLMLSYIPTAQINDVCCRLCYIITHLNYGMYNEVELYYSELSQTDIVKKTAEYIIDNSEVPEASIIDKDICTVSISLLEYINILNNVNEDFIIEELANYKIFFSKNLNIDFIMNNYGNPFLDTSKDSIKKIDKPIIKKHIDTEAELKLFKIFHND